MLKSMKKPILYMLWVSLYIICVGLGTVTQRSAAIHVFFFILSLLFFVPGIVLLVHGYRHNDTKVLKTVRFVSLASLVLTLCLIVLNILLVRADDSTGQLLNQLLIFVSAPMFCAYWRGVSLFLWACLFVSSFPRLLRK